MVNLNVEDKQTSSVYAIAISILQSETINDPLTDWLTDRGRSTSCDGKCNLKSVKWTNFPKIKISALSKSSLLLWLMLSKTTYDTDGIHTACLSKDFVCGEKIWGVAALFSWCACYKFETQKMNPIWDIIQSAIKICAFCQSVRKKWHKQQGKHACWLEYQEVKYKNWKSQRDFLIQTPKIECLFDCWVFLH